MPMTVFVKTAPLALCVLLFRTLADSNEVNQVSHQKTRRSIRFDTSQFHDHSAYNSATTDSNTTQIRCFPSHLRQQIPLHLHFNQRDAIFYFKNVIKLYLINWIILSPYISLVIMSFV